MAAVDRFGAVEVLVNNAASFEGGLFEELAPEQIERQFAVSVFGPMNVTRAVLPVMRRQRSGHVITISSVADLVGAAYTSAYAASKFAEPRALDGAGPRRGPHLSVSARQGSASVAVIPGASSAVGDHAASALQPSSA